MLMRRLLASDLTLATVEHDGQFVFLNNRLACKKAAAGPSTLKPSASQRLAQQLKPARNPGRLSSDRFVLASLEVDHY